MTAIGLSAPSSPQRDYYALARIRGDRLSKSRNLVVRKFQVNIPLPGMKVALGIIYGAERTAPRAGSKASDSKVGSPING